MGRNTTVLLLLGLSGVHGCASQEQKARRHVLDLDGPGYISMEPREVDVGLIRPGVTKEFKAFIVNEGSEMAEISELQATCSCIDVALQSQRCLPGKKVALRGKLRAPSNQGPFRQRVTLQLTKPSEEKLYLDIAGEVEPRIKLSPTTIELEPDCLDDAYVKAEMTIENTSGQKLRIGVFPHENKGITATLKKKDLLDKERAILAFETLDFFPADIDYEYVITTSHPLEESILVPVKVRPRHGIKITPSAIRLGVTSWDSLAGRTISVNLSGELLKTAHIEKITSPAFMPLQCQSPHAANGNLDLVLGVREDRSLLDLRGTVDLKFQTRIEKKPHRDFEVRIPVSGIIRR